MNMLLMALRAQRPSEMPDMKAVAKPLWIWRGYEAMTFFGHIITHSKEEAEAFNCQSNALKNHELIHLYQARSTHDSWLCFYALYIGYWLRATFACRTLRNAGYRLNPFEMEAYAHMDDSDYLRHRQEATEWRRYARLTIQQRLSLLRLGA